MAREAKTKLTSVGFSRSARRRVRNFLRDTLIRSGKATASFKATCPMKKKPLRSLTFTEASRTSQALVSETWLRLPRSPGADGPKSLEDPVCPLMLALSGHPDSGGIWENHCASQLEGNGWVQVLPEIWQSIFYHPDLELLLVIYVDDFKMAGPQGNLKKGWANISSVIDMDPPEPLVSTSVATTLSTHTHTHVKLPRTAHPFAYVFDKKDAPLAAAAARRSEDYWEVGPDLGAVVRHHVYPQATIRPNSRNVKEFPTMSPHRRTELDAGQIIHDDSNSHAAARQND